MKKTARKTRRQQLAEKLAVAQKRVDAANAVANPMSETFGRKKLSNGDWINMKCYRVKDINEKMLAWIFDLMERNMRKMYEESAWGWKPEEQQKVMTEDAAWYLIASTDDNENVGFSHFRFDMDHGVDILYCYELQLESKARRNGLGRFMMLILESMASQYQMQKVVLTVFKRNLAAVRFFHTIGYIFFFIFLSKVVILSYIAFIFVGADLVSIFFTIKRADTTLKAI